MNIHMWIWDYWPGPEGGAERQCRGLSRELVRLGHEVTVCCRAVAEKTPSKHEGVKINRFGKSTPPSGFLWKLQSYIDRLPDETLRAALTFWVSLPEMRKQRKRFIQDITHRYAQGELPDIIHVHETGWMAGLAVAVTGKTGVPVVAKVRSTPALETIGYGVPQRKRWEKFRRQSYFIALHSGLAGELVSEGISSGRIREIPNAVDLLENLPVEKPQTHDKTVLCVGNLTQGVELKGFDTVVQAWSLVHRAHTDARLIFAGRGDPSLLKMMAKEFNCSDSIQFPGFIEHPETLFQGASLFVVASRKEGMSNALLEAQAWGLPTVVSDIPANRAVCCENENGLFFPPGNSDVLAEKILFLFSNPAEMQRLGRASYERMKSNFSREAITRQIQDFYRDLLP